MSPSFWFAAGTRLEGGAWAVVEPIRPSDAPALARFFHELSADSRYHRFFGLMNDLSPSMLRYLTEIDGEHHVAVGAWVPDPGGKRLIGVARFIRSSDDPRAAEAAITVVDDMHHRGLGRHLLETLIDAARRGEIDRLLLMVMRTNQAMRGLVRGAGGKLIGERGTELTFEVRVSPPAATAVTPGSPRTAMGTSLPVVEPFSPDTASLERVAAMQ